MKPSVISCKIHLCIYIILCSVYFYKVEVVDFANREGKVHDHPLSRWTRENWHAHCLQSHILQEDGRGQGHCNCQREKVYNEIMSKNCLKKRHIHACM